MWNLSRACSAKGQGGRDWTEQLDSVSIVCVGRLTRQPRDPSRWCRSGASCHMSAPTAFCWPGHGGGDQQWAVHLSPSSWKVPGSVGGSEALLGAVSG